MNEQINDGGAAFPGGVNAVYTSIEQGEPTQPGMTLRDYFAAKAMQGGIAAADRLAPAAPNEFAERCYAYADAMLRARMPEVAAETSATAAAR